MADSQRLFPLLLQLVACAHRCRSIVTQVDEVLASTTQSTPASVLVCELSRGAKEMISALSAYEVVCTAAIALLNHPNTDVEAPRC